MFFFPAVCILYIFASLFSFQSFSTLSYTLHTMFIRNIPLWLSCILSLFPPLYNDFTFISLHCVEIFFSSIPLNRVATLYHFIPPFFIHSCFPVILVYCYLVFHSLDCFPYFGCCYYFLVCFFFCNYFLNFIVNFLFYFFFLHILSWSYFQKCFVLSRAYSFDILSLFSSF